MPTLTNSFPRLPDDVVISILSRLPVKSLLKFRCVSKSWLSLISCQHFIKTHLRNSKKYSNFTPHRIIFNYSGDLKHFAFQSLFHEPILDAQISLQQSKNSISIVGSCDGLICLVLDKKDLILWNPSTRKCKKLPDSGTKTNLGSYFGYGLGFDKSNDDYKVVAFFNSYNNLSEVIVKIYSSTNDKWKMIKNYKGRWLMDDPATFANGKLHWIADSERDEKSGWNIAYLDLETEEYGILDLPNHVESGFYSRLGAFEGCLYVLCSHLTRADVWIVEDCEVGKENWIKVASVPYIDDFLKYSYKKPLYVKNDEVLFLCGSRFVIFDIRDCSFRYPEIRSLDSFVSTSTYVESLVSPSG